MNTLLTCATAARMTLDADTAADLMSPNPVSIRSDASVQDAIALMTDRNFDSAPVIDERGKPIGVVTVTDILVHNREYVRFLKTGDPTLEADLACHSHLPADLGIEVVDRTSVEEIMTPAVLTVPENASARHVVRRMLDLMVHHLFVTDRDGLLVGVISAGDVLRRLN
jgi:CBS domain-containing protein